MSKFIAPTVITDDQIAPLLLASVAARAFQVAITNSGGAISPSIPEVAMFEAGGSHCFDPAFDVVARAQNGTVLDVKFAPGQNESYVKTLGRWVLTPKE